MPYPNSTLFRRWSTKEPWSILVDFKFNTFFWITIHGVLLPSIGSKKLSSFLENFENLLLLRIASIFLLLPPILNSTDKAISNYLHSPLTNIYLEDSWDFKLRQLLWTLSNPFWRHTKVTLFMLYPWSCKVFSTVQSSITMNILFFFGL